MSRPDEKLKLEVVHACLSGLRSTTEVASLLAVNERSVRRWMAVYRVHGEAGLRKRAKRRYDAAFKMAAVRCMRSEGLSPEETALRFGIRDLTVVGVWARRYDEGGLQALQPRPKGRPTSMRKPPLKPPVPSPVADEQRSRDELINELRWLRMENDYLKKLDALVQAKKTAASGKRRS